MFTDQNQNRIKYMLISLASVLLVVLVLAVIKFGREAYRSNQNQEATVQIKKMSPQEKQAQELNKINDIRKKTGADKPLTDEEAKKQLEEIKKIRQEQLK